MKESRHDSALHAGYRVTVRAVSFLIVLFCCIVSTAWADDATKKAAALYNEATVLFQEGDADKALASIRESIKADATCAEAHDQLGYILLSKHMNDEALGAFDAALNINPKLRTSKVGKGLVLLGKGDVMGAEEALKEALQLNPYPSMAHYALGLVYERRNEYTKAIEQYKEGIRTFKEGKR